MVGAVKCSHHVKQLSFVVKCIHTTGCIVRDENGNVIMKIDVNKVRKVEEGVAYRCLIEDSQCVLEELDEEDYNHLFGSQCDL